MTQKKNDLSSGRTAATYVLAYCHEKKLCHYTSDNVRFILQKLITDQPKKHFLCRGTAPQTFEELLLAGCGEEAELVRANLGASIWGEGTGTPRLDKYAVKPDRPQRIQIWGHEAPEQYPQWHLVSLALDALLTHSTGSLPSLAQEWNGNRPRPQYFLTFGGPPLDAGQLLWSDSGRAVRQHIT